MSRWRSDGRSRPQNTEISRQRSAHVVQTTGTIIRQPPPEESPLEEDRIVFLGPDPNGVMLEVMAIETNQGLLIIHAMKMRQKYRPFLKGNADA